MTIHIVSCGTCSLQGCYILLNFQATKKLGRIALMAKWAFPLRSLLCALVFIGFLAAVGDDGVGAHRFLLTLFQDFSWSAGFLLSPCQTTAVHHQRSCDCVHWMMILEVQILHCWVLLWAGCCRARSGLTEHSQWIWKWSRVFGWVVWQMLGGKKLQWHWNSLHTCCFCDFPAQDLIFGYFRVHMSW